MAMRDILDEQRAAFQGDLPVSVALRRDRLDRAIAMIGDHAERFCSALSEDFGHRSRDQSMIADIAASIAPLRHARDRCARWARPERRAVTFPLGLLGARAWVEYQPKGVVGVIAPWNFPVQLVMSPLAGVFAAGNRAMVKTSEYTPAVATLFAELAPRYFDQSELAFVSGGANAGAAFSRLPFDHLVFTGGAAVARHILAAAAENLTPVTLELGGKSPVVIGRGADFARATDRIVAGKLLNAGQICLAPDYVLVREADEDAVIAGLSAAAAAQYPRILDNPDYGAILDDRHFDRLRGLIDDARARGGEVIVVDPASEDFGRSNGRKMPLHIVRGATAEMAVMREEIFGPILPVVRYAAIDDAIDAINRRDRPLALYHFGSDAGERRRLLDRTISGGVTLDDVVFHVAQEELPFGGIGASGMGAYHGRTGFRTFSHERAIYRQPGFDIGRLAGLTPPYGARTRWTIKRQMKR